MAGPLRVEFDVSVGHWLQEVLHLDATITVAMPPIFDAYARIRHPSRLEVPAPPGAQLHGEVVGGGCLHPHVGDIPLTMLGQVVDLLLAEHGDAEVLAAVWEGSGLDVSSSSAVFFWDDDLPPAENERMARQLNEQEQRESAQAIDPMVRRAMAQGAVLGLPGEGGGRGHVLLRGRLRSLADPAWVETARLGWRPTGRGFVRTPNALWPAQPPAAPAWFVATELDSDVTLVGGTTSLIGRILADGRFEAERVTPSTSLFD